MQITPAQKGKRAEFLVFSKLLEKGADLYIPVTDTGIDALVQRKDGSYLEIQVKATEAQEQAGRFNVWDLEYRAKDRFFIVCVGTSKQPPEIWVLPCEVFQEYATVSKSKEGWNRYRLDMNSRDKRHKDKLRRDLLQEYREAWKLLTG